MISNFKFARKPRIPTSLVLDAFSRVPYSNNSSKQTSLDNATDMAFVSQLQIQVYFSDSIITTDTHIFLLCWREITWAIVDGGNAFPFQVVEIKPV